MSPPDQTDDDDQDASADGTARDGAEAAPEPNKVTGPLTNEELETGGLKSIQSYMRTEPAKDTLRKRKQRKKQQDTSGKRQMNIVVRDDDRSRATLRGTAAAIDDEAAHRAFEAVLATPDLAPLVADVAAKTELREIVELSRTAGDQRATATTELLDTAKLVVAHPDLAALMKRATATSRIQEAVEMTIANPEFALLGQLVATQRTICAWVARRLLRVRRRPGVNHGK